MQNIRDKIMQNVKEVMKQSMEKINLATMQIPAMNTRMRKNIVTELTAQNMGDSSKNENNKNRRNHANMGADQQ